MEADESQALCGALQTIDLGSVLDAVVEQAHRGLRDATVDARSSETDQDRRKALLLHLHQTRQRLLRLLVLVQWSNKAKATVEVSNVLEKAASHANTLRDAADQLYHQHNDPFLIRAPAHDVPTALDVLQTGSYNLLPSVIETLRSEPEASPRKRAAAVQLMDQLLRTRLLQEQLPRGLRVTRVANGAAELRSGDEYEVKLILVPAPEQTSNAAQSGKEQSEEAAARQAGEPSSSGRQRPEDAVDTKTGPEKSRASSHGEEWRWRIMSLTILPGPKTDAWMTPAQTMYLQQQTDELMWRAADAILLRAKQTGPASSTAEASAPPVKLEQPGMLGATSEAALQSSSLHAASSGLGSSGLGSELDKGRPTEAQSGAADLAQAVPPLEMMHSVLRMTAHRLVVLEAMAWAQQQVQSPEQRWHKLLRREKGRLLTGGRITYWLEVKTVTAAELHQLAAPTNGNAQKGVIATAAPALELGMDPQSQLKLVHEPALSEVDDSGAAQAPVDLQIDLHTADLEGALLQAAAATANIQLAALSGLLRSRGEISGNNGEVLLDCRRAASANSTAALHPGNLRGHSSGVLELRSLGTSLLCVSVQLTNGQMLLRAGRSLQDSAEIAVHIRGEEDKLFALQKQTRPNGVQLSAGHFALLQVARSLEKLFLQLCLRQRFLSHSSCVGRFGLVQVPMPARALKEYLRNNPLAPRFSSKHITMSSFPPPPPILSMLPMDDGPSERPSPAGSRKSTPGLDLSPLADLSPGTGGGTASQAPPFQNMGSPGGRGPAGRAQIDAGSSGHWDVKSPGAATPILGEGGRGLQFLLASELKAGMRWEYALLSMSCDARGQPLKVLNLVKVPDCTPPPRQTSGKRKREEEEAAEAGPLPRRQAGMQADDAAGNAVSPSEAQLAGVVSWCRERIAWEQLSLHLQVMGVPFQRALVPAASAKRLQTAGSLALGPSTPAEIAWQQRAAPRKGSVQSLVEAEAAASSQQQPNAERSALETPEQRLWVDGLAVLENLDGCVDAAPVGSPQLEFSVGRASSGFSDTAWTLGVGSAYLASLQQAAYQPSDGGERLLSGGAIELTQEGLLFSYPSAAGATAWSALQDLGCITRLQSCVQRVRQLCNARAEAEPPSPRLSKRPSSQPSDSASQVPKWSVHRSGSVILTAVAVQSAQLRVHAAANWDAALPEASRPAGQDRAELARATDPGGLQSVEVQNPQTPPSTIFSQDYEPVEDPPLQQTRRSDQQQGLPETGQLSDIFGDTGFTNDGFTADGFALDSFDLQPFRMHTSVAATAAVPALESGRFTQPPPEAPAAEVPAPEKLEEAAAAASLPNRVSAVEETLAVSLTLRWQPCASGGGSDTRRIACRLEAEPRIPAAVLSALQEMLDVGEEEVFLDALCICAAPLAVLVAVLRPSALAECGLQAARVVLLWPRPPYRAQLLMQTPDGFLLICTLHFFAASLVWLSSSLQRTSRPQAAAAALAAAKGGPDLPSLQPLLAKLLQIPGVSPPEEDVGGAGSGGTQWKPAGGGALLGTAKSKVHPRAGAARQSAGGVWCRSWALEQALGTVFRFAAGERV